MHSLVQLRRELLPGLTRAGVSVWAPASLSVFAGLLSFVIAMIFTNYALFGMNVKIFCLITQTRQVIKKTAQRAVSENLNFHLLFLFMLSLLRNCY